MKRRTTTTVAVAALLVAAGVTAAPGAVACEPSHEPPAAHGAAYGRTVVDPGEVPYVFDIQKSSLKNRNFRAAAWTGDTLQVTLMSIPVRGDVGTEIHHGVDQFFRVERGTARVMMGTSKAYTYVKDVGPGDVILIPSGTWHNIVNTGSTPLQLYSIYGPRQHPRGTVHPTQADDPHSGQPVPKPTPGEATPVDAFHADPGAVPFVFDIDQATAVNTNFRTAAWTGSTLQLTLMNIPVRGDVGLEMHGNVDQFIRVEEGRAKVYFGTSKQHLKFAGNASAGDAILIPSGTWHNIVNSSPKEDLKLYSLYGPVQHPKGTIHVTQEDGED